MFTDEITLHLKAGNGGDGIVAWRHEKGIDHAGPGGGDGGNGGDVYVKGVRDIAKLADYRFEKDFSAGHGRAGRNKGMKGERGSDLVIEVQSVRSSKIYIPKKYLIFYPKKKF